jgi:hypothetical protein
MITDAPSAVNAYAPPFALRAQARWQTSDGRRREELSGLLDLTPRGATLLLPEPPELGQLLCLQLPGARGDAGGERTLALVWAVARPADAGAAGGPERHPVSVVFVNDEVPGASGGGDSAVYDYLMEEDGRLRLQRQQAQATRVQRRRESRLSVPVEVTLEAMKADGTALMREHTVTENISRGGAAVLTSLLVGVHQAVRLTSARDGVSLTAVVRARRVGADGITRLHLEFTDGQWPLEKIA